MKSSAHLSPGPHPLLAAAVPRPQVSIERLPARRQVNEPRESMNCKSCRKRKIKCNRLRPACEACQIFQCPCIYDAVPKKRGPKTDVLEALLKRVDGLEAQLKDKNAQEATAKAAEPAGGRVVEPASAANAAVAEPSSDRDMADADRSSAPSSVLSRQSPPSPACAAALVDAYFAHSHGQPYYILDEAPVRQRIDSSQLPDFLCFAVCAVAARYAPHPGGQHAAAKLGDDFAVSARRGVDVDEPSIDGLQALLLLVLAFIASGKGKKAYMLMTCAIGMATALELNREVVETEARMTPARRELRRRLFWTCYLLDRSLGCGSRRPSLIRDKSIVLRLPSWRPSPSSPPLDGDFFRPGSNLQHLHGTGKQSQSRTAMLVDVARLLGITNRYLAAGGVKGDSHFPWHSLSTLSRIRRELDYWAAGAGDVFSASLPVLLRQPESTILMLSKLLYHLIHCLVYRPFLPVHLAELSGNDQHQSWQIEATNMCFLHANAIAELVDCAKQAGTAEWPALVGFCICTAATVHIHGAHYTAAGPGPDLAFFRSSSDFLSREMQQLGELQNAWANVHHQLETLQGIYRAHGDLVRALVGSAARHAPAFHLDDFFDRYTNIGGLGGKTFRFDPAHLSLSDPAAELAARPRPADEPSAAPEGGRPSLKRKIPASAAEDRQDARAASLTDAQDPGTCGPPPSSWRHANTSARRMPRGPIT
ncbi:hypothetical protein CDD83_8922 [Cordyceps sp. RAO-2017]|nr:hypothetical protein CDD83_8922 [Cordyceps sp. RAO-2017]